MNEFKFTSREYELKEAKDAIKSNDFTIYNYYNNSGITHFLKKLQQDLCNEKNLCFYIDCNGTDRIAEQIIKQILSGYNENMLNTFIKKKKTVEVVKKILLPLIRNIDAIPYINIAGLGADVIEAIIDSIDVDLEHISDYKIEKALIKLLNRFNEKKNIETICLLLDNTDNLDQNSIDFLASVINYDFIKIMFMRQNTLLNGGTEALSKLSSAEFNTWQINTCFDRPNDMLIKKLFECYGTEFKDEYMTVFKEYNRNIHVIISYIRGFNMDFQAMDNTTLTILKILLIVKTKLSIKLVLDILTNMQDAYELNPQCDFENTLKQIEEKNLIIINDNVISLNKNIVTSSNIKIIQSDKLYITAYILNAFESNINILTIEQLKFAIDNLTRDYNKRKKYIFLLLKQEKNANCIELKYLDMLLSCNKSELFEACSMYYNMQIYDMPSTLLLQHKQFSQCRQYLILSSLLDERLHRENYGDKLKALIDSSKNSNEKCLLTAIYFTALFNENKSNLGIKILQDNENELYYEKFSNSKYYYYLLRNVSYYIDNIDEAKLNYELCLFNFENTDPVNYNRTMSNYVGYLLAHDCQKSREILESLISKIEGILQFNDTRYLYLNINYGIYLIKTGHSNPTKYFNAIIYEEGTTETPYIYSQINLSLYIAKTSPIKALMLLQKIYSAHIENSNVKPTKIYYYINRILVEYMNGKNNMNLLEYIKENPLRGNEKQANALYNEYKYRFENSIKYCEEDFDKLFLPGPIFYHGFDVDLLLSLDNPSSII